MSYRMFGTGTRRPRTRPGPGAAARPWQAGVSYDDGWNEAHVNARRGLPLITVVDGATGAHRRLVNLLEAADDDALAEVGRAHWGAEISLLEMIYDVALHYAEHAQSLDRYQRTCLDAEEPPQDGGTSGAEQSTV